ncbi:MAG: D-alanyl-D-alanine carboxypeptidase [Lachnospiraceae bacterium]|nr:D-alanyl-D-alanine carboxypeptidase [Lachnospiraceae bacterium]
MSIITLVAGSFSGNIHAKEIVDWPQGPDTQSAAAIVVEIETGAILYEKNIHNVHYPASITKIMTTLLALENSDMQEVVTFSEDSVFKTEGSGIARDVGEQMTMEQCLYAVMLESANECAYAVGEHVAGGSIDAFVNMMNERATELGCLNTHFNNSNGLPDEQHYTTAYDMALIAREAYLNEDFRTICGTKNYTIPFTNKHTDEETYLNNHHQMLFPLTTGKYLYEYCLGGKTGYTTVANSTLVTYAQKDGMTLACVVLNAPSGGHYEDTRGLFDFCFENFKMMNIEENETGYIQEEKKYASFVDIDSSGSVVLPVTAKFEDMKSEIVYDNTDADVVGTIAYTYGERFVGGADIIANDNIAIETFEFHPQDTEEVKGEDTTKEKTVKIPVSFIFKCIGIGIAVIVLIFLIWKFIDNFYLIKRKLNMNRRDKSPYKEIKKNKMYRRRRRTRF